MSKKNVNVRMSEEQIDIAKRISLIATGEENISEGVRRALVNYNVLIAPERRAVDLFDEDFLELFLTNEPFRSKVSLWKLLRQDFAQV